MVHPHFTFVITHKVAVHPDFHRKRAIISCETEDGKSVRIDADFKTLEKLHDEIRKQLEAT
jgi:hypothetical protein